MGVGRRKKVLIFIDIFRDGLGVSRPCKYICRGGSPPQPPLQMGAICRG
jgi:hypothetical protein